MDDEGFCAPVKLPRVETIPRIERIGCVLLGNGVGLGKAFWMTWCPCVTEPLASALAFIATAAAPFIHPICVLCIVYYFSLQKMSPLLYNM